MCWRASTAARSEHRVIGALQVAARHHASNIITNNRPSPVDKPWGAGAGSVARSGEEKKLRALFTGRRALRQKIHAESS